MIHSFSNDRLIGLCKQSSMNVVQKRIAKLFYSGLTGYKTLFRLNYGVFFLYVLCYFGSIKSHNNPLNEVKSHVSFEVMKHDYKQKV